MKNKIFMKQLILNIPDSLYNTVLKLLKSRFSDIQIKEETTENTNIISDVEGAYETMLLSEDTLSKDWLSKEEDEAWKDL